MEASQILLSALAQIGHSDLPLKQAALAEGALELDPQHQFHWDLIPIEKCNLSQIDQALNHLVEAAPPLKLKLLHACVAVVSADGVVQIREAELLRAITDSLDCPLPPLLADPEGQPARMTS